MAARNEAKCWVLWSMTSKATEAMIATSSRVVFDGPVANKSFMA